MQVSDTPWHRLTVAGLASVKVKKQGKRKASVADLILYNRGDQGKLDLPLLISR